MNADLVRYIDSIHRDKGIDKEVLFLALEDALIGTIKKKYDLDDDFTLSFHRETGEMESNYEINFEELGRIFAQTVKQTWFTKIKEAERDVLFNEYEEKVGDIVTGTIQRFEREDVIVALGKVEGVIPRPEKVRGESYHIGERIRAYVLEVKKVGLKVKIILSRASTGLTRRLFELEVPEIADNVIEVKKLEREPGYRTKIAVTSSDPRVDCVGACVGVRGTRIKSIIDALNGERIDIIRWSEDPQQMLINALQPSDVSHIQLDMDNHKALVLVEEEQLSLAIGRKGQNVRLASKLTGWDIDIMTRAELEETLAQEEKAENGDEAGAAEASADSPAEGDASSEDASSEDASSEAASSEAASSEAASPEAASPEAASPEAASNEAAPVDAEEADGPASGEPATDATVSETEHADAGKEAGKPDEAASNEVASDEVASDEAKSENAALAEDLAAETPPAPASNEAENTEGGDVKLSS